MAGNTVTAILPADVTWRLDDLGRSHGWDVKSVCWHPSKALLASGSKDQTVKLWDPRAAKEAAVLHLHNGMVTALTWHPSNGWLLSGSRDQSIKLFDLRAMREVCAFRNHQREVTALAWHPVHAELFVAGTQEGTVTFWSTSHHEAPLSSCSQPAQMGRPAHPNGHASAVHGAAWHPLGHMLATCSQDTGTKFWVRPRPGEGRKRPAAEAEAEAAALDAHAMYQGGRGRGGPPPHARARQAY